MDKTNVSEIHLCHFVRTNSPRHTHCHPFDGEESRAVHSRQVDMGILGQTYLYGDIFYGYGEIVIVCFFLLSDLRLFFE
jgi:hypothetical protein